jgi:hypothetical protein
VPCCCWRSWVSLARELSKACCDAVEVGTCNKAFKAAEKEAAIRRSLQMKRGWKGCSRCGLSVEADTYSKAFKAEKHKAAIRRSLQMKRG